MERHAELNKGRDEDRGRRLEGALADTFPDATESARSEVEFFRAPGRINLMGAHTDYNDGLVLDSAIDVDTWIAVRWRSDGLVRIASLQSPDRAEFRIDELEALRSAGTPPAREAPLGGRAQRPSWSDHVAAMAWSLHEAALPVRGFDGVFDSTIPPGAGLGWAAALELVSGLTLLARERLVSAPMLAALAQRAERDFLGVSGGIVDTFAAAAGRAGRAMLLDCRSLESRYVTMPAGVTVVVCDTGADQGATVPAEAVFLERRAECGRAVALLAQEVPSVASLRDLDTETLRKNRHLLSEAVARRAEHVVAENERVVAAAAALGSGDLDELGRLFAASHESLRTLYEVSSPALDAMVEVARSVPGVVAARMTGPGFGGCTVNLVRDAAVPALERAVAAEYPRRTGLTPRVYSVSTVAGAGPV
jgi:galactokinase